MNNQNHNPHEVNLLDMRRELDQAQEGSKGDSRSLILTRVGGSPVPLVMFDYQAVAVPVHFLKTAKHKGLFRCNGEGCLLCATKQFKLHKVVFPVYNLFTKRVELLAVDDQRDPGSALADILIILGSQPGDMVVLTIRQVDYVYTVTKKKMSPDVQIDQAAIDRFKEERERGLDLISVYPQKTNEELGTIPEIAMLLGLEDE